MTKPSISPTVWQPPAPPPGQGLPLPPLRAVEVGTGPEDVLVEPDGAALTGLADGRVVRIRGDVVTTVADTRGRPLGLEFLPDGRVLVVDTTGRLLALDAATGEQETLLTQVEGQVPVFLNNAAVAPDGTIWVSDSSARHPIEYAEAEVAEHSGTGRILRRDPDGTVTTVLGGLQFPNGVALGPDGRSLFYVETGSFTLVRLTLDRKAGAGAEIAGSEVVIASLPGYPDNMSLGSDGLLWIAVATPRNPVLDIAARLPGVIRRIGWALPEVLQPKPSRVLGVLAVDPATGSVVHDLRGRHDGYRMITGVREHEGTVWMSSLKSAAVMSFRVPGAG